MPLKKSDPNSRLLAARPISGLLPGDEPAPLWLFTTAFNLIIAVVIGLAVWAGLHWEYFDGIVHVHLPRTRDLFTFNFGPYDARKFMLMGIAVIMAVSLQLINGVSGQFSLGHAGFMAVGAYASGYASLTYGALDPEDPATNYQNGGQVLWFFFCLALLLAVAAALLGGIFLLLQQTRKIARWMPPLLMLAALAWFTWDFSSGYGVERAPPRFVCTHLIRTLLSSYGWLLEHGMPAAKFVSLHLPALIRRPLCFLILLAGGGLFAAAAGLLVGLPTLRLRGDYLAIVTLGFAQILLVIFTNCDAVGRTTGLSVTPYCNVADPDRDPVRHYIFPWILAMMVITVVTIWRIAYSPKGRLIQAVREDEIASAAIGINTTRQKVTAFVVGAFFAGIGGVLYVHREGYVNPSSFGLDWSLLYVVMVTLGGLGSISGAMLAAIILTEIPFRLRSLASGSGLTDSAHDTTHEFLQKWFSNQNALFALILIIVMLVRPKGLLGGHELWFRRRKRLRIVPQPPPLAGTNTEAVQT